jgi:hypothetical protein
MTIIKNLLTQGAIIMPKVSEMVNKYEKDHIQKDIVLSGHGEWHVTYGYVPTDTRRNTTISFYIADGVGLPQNIGVRVDTGDFSVCLETYVDGDNRRLKNYVLLPGDWKPVGDSYGPKKQANIGGTLANVLMDDPDDHIIHTARSTHTNVINVSTDYPIWLTDIIEVYKGQRLHWAACRVVEAPVGSVATAWHMKHHKTVGSTV